MSLDRIFLGELLLVLTLILPRGQTPSNVAIDDSRVLLNKLVVVGSLPNRRRADFSVCRSQIEAFYRPTHYALAWTHSGLPTDQARAIIYMLSHADRKGLNPDDYDGSRWANRLALLTQFPPSTSASELARFDLELTISVVRYISDLHLGRANPNLFHAQSDSDPGAGDVGTFARQKLVDAVDVNSVIDSVEPPYPGYRRTEEALLKYRALSRMDDGQPLPTVRKTIERDQNYVAAYRLAKKLVFLGDLPPDTMIRPETTTYSSAIMKGVERFQTRHGLQSDGRLDNRTIGQLNVPLGHRVLQLQLALERWRWIPHSLSGPLIVVNIPEFKMCALDLNRSAKLEMDVIVGVASQHQTPVFAANLSSVIFRPYWNVPRDIVQAELLPKLERDRSYLARFGFQVVDMHGTTVRTGNSVDDSMLAQLRSGVFHIRQIPGNRNALGLVKFVFSNGYNIYMHGTPETELFSKSRRDFSHGCIRVARPAELAAWILRSQPGWTLPRVYGAMNGTTTMPVMLDHAIPILIVYTTAIVLENGEERFFEDIYGQDSRLEQSLIRRHLYRCPNAKRGIPVN